MEVNRREIFRYLGYGATPPDEATAQLAEECLHDLAQYAACKSIHRSFRLTRQDDTLYFGGLTVTSRNLGKNLRGCSEVVLFAATLGPAVDRLIARYSHMQMSRAAVMQAAAAAYIEEYCDTCQREITAQAHARGLFVRPRFSPGYGDFSIEHQRALTRVLDTPRRIGLTVTEGLALVPGKSVTAVMGLSPTDEKCHIAGCEACAKRDCAFRRS